MNLFLIPDELIIFISLLAVGLILFSSLRNNVIVGVLLFLFLNDGLVFLIGASTFSVLKVVSLIGIIYLLGNLDRDIVGVLFIIFWLALVNFISVFANEVELESTRYLIQYGVFWMGSLAVIKIIVERLRSQQKMIDLSHLKIFLMANLSLCIYQYFGSGLGLPINGINSAYTALNLDGWIKYAAYTYEGTSFFRPYGLFLEPKFMANTMAIFSAMFTIFYLRRYWLLKEFLIYQLVVLFPILLSASTSAYISVILMNAMVVLFNGGFQRRFLMIAAAFIALSVILFLFYDYIVDLLKVRVIDRLLDGEALESQEEYYLSKLLGNPISIIIGNGFSEFSRNEKNLGFRLLPNNALIFNLTIGGFVFLYLLFSHFCIFYRNLTNAKIKESFAVVAPLFVSFFIYSPPTIFFISYLYLYLISSMNKGCLPLANISMNRISNKC